MTGREQLSAKSSPRPRCISVQEAAVMLGVSVPCIRQWVAARKHLDVYRLGRRVLVSVESIDRLLADSLVPHRLEQ